MNRDAEPGSEPDVHASGLRMKMFMALGVATVLSFSVYSFVAVGRAFAGQEGTHLCAWGETDADGMPSPLEGLDGGRGICIFVPQETEGAASRMWGWKGFHVLYAHQIHLDSNAWR